MRILIADDTAPVRSAVRRLLKEEADLQIVGEAVNLGELMRLTRTLQPDLILLDWELSGLPGSTQTHAANTPLLNAAAKRRNVILAGLRHFQSHPRIIVLSSRPEAELTSHSAGADAFILKGDPPEVLLTILRSLCASDAD